MFFSKTFYKILNEFISKFNLERSFFMGLFDKLKGAVDIAKDSINKAIESMQEENSSVGVEDPLQDEIVRLYRENDIKIYLGGEEK